MDHEDLDNFDSQIKKITNYEIRFLSEFKNLYRLAINNHKQLRVQLKRPEIQENSHLIISLSLTNGEKTNFK